MIKAIVFDVDGTLYNETDAKVIAEIKTAQFISEQTKYSMLEVYRAYRLAKAQVIKQNDGYTIRNDRTLWYESTLNSLTITNITPTKASDFYWDIVLQNMEPYLDLSLVIEDLAKNYQLYVLTDEFLDIQLRKLNQLKLTDYFCEIVSSEQIGKTKPNKELFQYMIDVVGLPAENIAMIGDNPKVDVLGANLAGMHSVWLKRGKYHCYLFPDGNKPKIVIDNYLKLHDELKRV